MVTIFAVDALEYDKVEEFGCENLKQKFYGKTDITEFSQPRTMVLWSSFMTGENKEAEILAKGDKNMWGTCIPIEETFFSKFSNAKIIDLPGFNYDKAQHDKERELLKSFFEVEDPVKKDNIKKVYNQHVLLHHKKVKEEFLVELDAGHDLLLGYFSVADVIGHLNFGNTTMMKMIYDDLDEIAGKINGDVLVLSDHGMEAIGKFGDHSGYGFWSTNFKDLGEPLAEDGEKHRPKITDFASVLTGL